MKEIGILFTAEMVRALLDKRKTQTRRVVNAARGEQREWFTPELMTSSPSAKMYPGGAQFEHPRGGSLGFVTCPYGAPGDRLWVRENISKPHEFDVKARNFTGFYQATDSERKIRWIPSIHMPRWASRITLEITDVRVERVQDISEADAIAEGFDRDTCASAFLGAFGQFSDDDVEYMRWLERPDGSSDEDYCVDCAEKAAKKKRNKGSIIDGWNEYFESDSPRWCDTCPKLLRHSLTKYGVENELMIGRGYEHAPQHFAVRGSDAWVLHNLADGIGSLCEEHLGRLAQFGFGTLWNTLNEERGFGWDANPWVWVISFKEVTA